MDLVKEKLYKRLPQRVYKECAIISDPCFSACYDSFTHYSQLPESNQFSAFKESSFEVALAFLNF